MQRPATRTHSALNYRRAPLLTALLLATALLAACGGGGGTPPPAEPNVFLLMANTTAGRVEVMTAVDDPGDLKRDPGAGFGPATPTPVHTPAYGPDGRIYVADSANAQILVYDAAQALAQATPAPVATLSSPAFVQPMALAFSPEGALWVADRRNSVSTAPVANRLFRLGAVTGLTGAQTLTPEASIELELPNTASAPNATLSSIHLDTMGNLWFTDMLDWSVGRIDAASLLTGDITGYVPDLKFASITFGTPADSPIRNPTSLAFDSLGRLYVGSVNQSFVARYDVPAALVDGERETVPSATIRVLGAPLANAALIGFDQDGALWVASSATTEGAKAELMRLGVPGGATGEINLTPTARFEWSNDGRTSGGALLFHPPATPN